MRVHSSRCHNAVAETKSQGEVRAAMIGAVRIYYGVLGKDIESAESLVDTWMSKEQWQDRIDVRSHGVFTRQLVLLFLVDCAGVAFVKTGMHASLGAK